MPTNIEFPASRCYASAEGTEEAFLRILIDNGELASERWEWGPSSMRAGDAQSINWATQYHDGIRVEIWDDDPSNDDLIGEIVLDDKEGEILGEQSHWFLAPSGFNEYNDEPTYSVNPDRKRSYYLRLVSLKCSDAKEGADEPKLILNGALVWGPGRSNSAASTGA